MDLLSTNELLVMSAIVALGRNEAYGLAIHRKVRELAFPQEFSYGSLYPTLERLEKKKYVKSRQVDPPADRGGLPRRYFEMEGTGEMALQAARQSMERLIPLLQWEGGV